MSHVEWPLYEVFIRSKQGLAHRHVGSLHAADDQMALENARDAYTRRDLPAARRSDGAIAPPRSSSLRCGAYR
nr:hypothetical protein [Klebsiella quasipneumoniae]